MTCAKGACANPPAPERKLCGDHLEQARTRYHALTPEEKIDRDVRRMYGITGEDYMALMERQRGVCAICGAAESGYKKGTLCRLSVDHDHDTGRVRGLLCNNCNRGLGFLKDSPLLIAAALAYLEIS